MRDTWPLLQTIPFPALRRRSISTLQVNVGYRCNQSCVHCHVNAGPGRTEEMTGETIDLVIEVLNRRRIETLDVTGGAPELNPHFRRLVGTARKRGVKVIDRCNLTILEEPDHADLADFLAAEEVEIIASLPCYRECNVDQQRGRGVFATSIRALRRLNALGYGRDGSGLVLNLVYNPQGPSLPPPQAALEADYRRELGADHGVRFNNLLTLANMPIQRFGATLLAKREFARYLALLQSAHHADNLAKVMCRDLVSVDWQGFLYDCDFNQMLDLPLSPRGNGCTDRLHLATLLDPTFVSRSIRVAGHCFGCTAGQGSSCGGALDEAAE
jgi:radical SAM/Cys-rich protein